jgi:hypothetical protein
MEQREYLAGYFPKILDQINSYIIYEHIFLGNNHFLFVGAKRKRAVLDVNSAAKLNYTIAPRKVDTFFFENTESGYWLAVLTGR